MLCNVSNYKITDSAVFHHFSALEPSRYHITKYISTLDSAIVSSDQEISSNMSLQLEMPMTGFSPEVTSPTLELGYDFERLLRRCIHENERKKKLANLAGNLDGLIITEPIKTNQEEQVECENADLKTTITIISGDNTSNLDTVSMNTAEEIKPVAVPDKSVETMYKCKRKKKAKLKKKHQGEKKPWTSVNLECFSFEFSLLPRREVVLDEETVEEIDREFERFQEECRKEDDSEVDVKNKCVSTKKNGVVAKKDDSVAKKNKLEMDKIGYEYVINFRPRPETWDDVEYDRFWNHYSLEVYFEDHLSTKQITYHQSIEQGMKEGHLRSKKKWRIMKAHQQIKTKHCQSVHNGPHGQKFYMSHRVYLRMKMFNCPLRKSLPSMKRIDREKGIKPRDDSVQTPDYKVPPAPRPPPAQRQYPVAQPTPHAAISAYNFDGDLPPDLVNILVHLQTRDLTPEDYDLLLRLDERVQPKTVSETQLESFKTDTVTSETAGALCAVCMEAYEIGQVRKFLPCTHVFHKQCIDMWLSNSSPSCPLDGTEVGI